MSSAFHTGPKLTTLALGPDDKTPLVDVALVTRPAFWRHVPDSLLVRCRLLVRGAARISADRVPLEGSETAEAVTTLIVPILTHPAGRVLQIHRPPRPGGPACRAQALPHTYRSMLASDRGLVKPISNHRRTVTALFSPAELGLCGIVQTVSPCRRLDSTKRPDRKPRRRRPGSVIAALRHRICIPPSRRLRLEMPPRGRFWPPPQWSIPCRRARWGAPRSRCRMRRACATRRRRLP